MRSLPKELQELYPQPVFRKWGPPKWISIGSLNHDPERPWWRNVAGTAEADPEGNPEEQWFRSDGSPDFSRPVRFAGGDSRWNTAAELKPFREEQDRRHPLPHPNYRPGQTWGRVIRGQAEILTITDRLILGIKPVYIMMATRFSEAELVEELDGAFLLVDAGCPHLAPWAPAENPNDPG